MIEEFDTVDVTYRIFQILENENILEQIDPFTRKSLSEDIALLIERRLEDMPNSYDVGYDEGYSQGKDAGYEQGVDAAKEKMSDFLEEMDLY